MALPHFTKDVSHKVSPIYTNNYIIHYISDDITSEEKELLTNNTYKVKYKNIQVNINSKDTGGIPVLEALSKLKTFDLKLIVTNTEKDVLGYFYYKGCTIENLYEKFINFSYEQRTVNRDIIRPHFNVICDDITYTNIDNPKSYERIQKIERIIGDE
jgi:hypothetical protein